jgi:threonylcarbamoyladenosine tRNA methylthiotransferase MtaB
MPPFAYTASEWRRYYPYGDEEEIITQNFTMICSRLFQQRSLTLLWADVIVGFPGKVNNFKIRFVYRGFALTHLHVFSYSPRPGTSAAEMKEQVPASVKKKRSEMLRLLGSEKNLMFRKKILETVMNVVVEAKSDASKDMLTGLTDNYIRVFIDGADDEQIGRVIPVRITKVDGKSTLSNAL